jgi:ATP-dependent exoDNAse (exonuclease V) beta subunit
MATFLAQKNKHPKDDDILLDEATHIYTINGQSGQHTSVTRWIHNLFPSFDADAIIDKMMASKKWAHSKYFGKTKEEIKALWSENGNKASKAGTKLHEDIEYFWNGTPRENDSIEYTYFKQFCEKHKDLTPWRTEMMVYHDEWGFAGSIDMIFENPDGSVQIYDWKRCKEIRKSNMFECAKEECIAHLPNTNYWHYALQLNTYKAIIEDKYGKKVTNMYLVCLHPSQKSFIKIKVPYLQSEMEDLLALRVQKLNQCARM